MRAGTICVFDACSKRLASNDRLFQPGEAEVLAAHCCIADDWLLAARAGSFAFGGSILMFAGLCPRSLSETVVGSQLTHLACKPALMVGRVLHQWRIVERVRDAGREGQVVA